MCSNQVQNQVFFKFVCVCVRGANQVNSTSGGEVAEPPRMQKCGFFEAGVYCLFLKK